MRVRRCPRCRCTTLAATESTEALKFFTIRAGVIAVVGEDFGCITGVWLTCTACNHQWKPRGANQITDLGRMETEGRRQ